MMKNNFLFLVMFLGVALFSGCSDDDDPMIPPKDLNTTFGEGETMLNMTYGGSALVGKQVKFNTTDSKTATLTLLDVVPGQVETTINGIQLVEDNDMYKFEGSTSLSRAEASQGSIAYSGSVKKGELTLNLTITMPDNQGWVKTYKLGEYTCEPAEYDGEPLENWALSGALYCDWEGSVEDYGFIFSGIFRVIGGALLPQVVEIISLESDGNITANYIEKPNIVFEPSLVMNTLGGKAPTVEEIQNLIPASGWVKSPKNLAYWFEKDNRMYVKLNIPSIIAQSIPDNGNSNTAINTIVSGILNGNATTIKELTKGIGFDLSNVSDKSINLILDWAKNGIPMSVKNENGHTYIYLDRTLFDALLTTYDTGEVDDWDDPIMTADLLEIWKVLVAAEIIPEEMQMAGILLGSLVQSWPGTTEFGLGLDLVAQ